MARVATARIARPIKPYNGGSVQGRKLSEVLSYFEPLLKQLLTEYRGSRRSNIVDIRLSPKISVHKRLNELSIQFVVKEKFEDDELSQNNSPKIPKYVRYKGKRFATDVVESSEKQDAPAAAIQRAGVDVHRNIRTQKVQAGVGISKDSRRAGAGTLGAIVFKGGEPHGLTNRHILNQRKKYVVQPAWQRGQVNRIGYTVKVGSIFSSMNDYALLKIDPPEVDGARTEVSRKVMATHVQVVEGQGRSEVKRTRRDFTISGRTSPAFGMPVKKSGRTTGLTYGVVSGVTSRGFVEISPSEDPAKRPPNDEISMGGDSGAVWVTEHSNKAVALHRAGENESRNPHFSQERAYGISIGRVASALDISFTH